MDTHIIMVSSPAGPVPTPTPMPFAGKLNNQLSSTVHIDGQPAATKGSTADNSPPHVPAGGPFQKPPANRATVKSGSNSVIIDGQQAARAGDPADTCNDPADAPNGVIMAQGSVLIG